MLHELSLQAVNRRVSASRDQDLVERDCRRPRVLLSFEMSLTKQVVRVEAEARDRCLDRLVVRTCRVQL
jgi:hypothetical protein